METESPVLENIAEQAAVFGALADPTRLKLVKLLCRQHAPDALCVNALAGLLGVTQPAVSQHLRVLRTIGLVKGERRGYNIHYFMNLDVLERYRKIVSEALIAEGPLNEKLCDNCCSKKEKQDASRV